MTEEITRSKCWSYYFKCPVGRITLVVLGLLFTVTGLAWQRMERIQVRSDTQSTTITIHMQEIKVRLAQIETTLVWIRKDLDRSEARPPSSP